MGLIGLIRLIGEPLWYALPDIIISRGGNVPLRGVAPSRWSGLIDSRKPRKRRNTYYHSPVVLQPNDRRNRQPAYFRGVIAQPGGFCRGAARGAYLRT